MQVEWYELAIAIVGSATFGAVIGKVMDAFLLAKINNAYEKKKWLRQAKLEAFTELSQELLSLGLKSEVFDDEWRFRALTARAMLLIENEKNLIEKIRSFISILTEENRKNRNIGDVAAMAEKGLVLNDLNIRALEIVKSLKDELNKT